MPFDLNALLQSNPLILTIIMAIIMAVTIFYVTRNSGKSNDRLAEAITLLVTNEGNRDQRIQKLADRMEGLEPLAKSIGELAAKIGAQTLENADNKKLTAEMLGKLGFANTLSGDWIERAKKAQEDAAKAMSEVAENSQKIEQLKTELQSLKGAVDSIGQKIDTLITTDQSETAAIQSLRVTVEKLQQAFEAQKSSVVSNTINVPPVPDPTHVIATSEPSAKSAKSATAPIALTDPKPSEAQPAPIIEVKPDAPPSAT